MDSQRINITLSNDLMDQVLLGNKTIDIGISGGRWEGIENGDIIRFWSYKCKDGHLYIVKNITKMKDFPSALISTSIREASLPGMDYDESIRFYGELYMSSRSSIESIGIIVVEFENYSTSLIKSNTWDDSWVFNSRYSRSTHEQETQEWLDARKRLGITGSKFGTLLEVNKGNVPLSWLDPPKVCTDAMKRGNELEPMIRKWFETSKYFIAYSSLIGGAKLEEVGLVVPLWNPLIGVSVDGLISGSHDDFPAAIIEIKTMERIPQSYRGIEDHSIESIRKIVDGCHYGQMQGGMAIFQVPLCFYICFSPATKQMVVINVKSDQDYWRNELYPDIIKYLRFTF